jgi:hypothetical protein
MKSTDVKGLYLGLNPRSGTQITKLLKVWADQVCLAVFIYSPTVAGWLQQLNSALLAHVKDDTPFELLFGRIRLSRTDAPGCPPKSKLSTGCPSAEALRHNGSHG